MVNEAAQFLDDLFAGQSGWLCLGSIDGDPSIPKGAHGYSPMKSEWYMWPKQQHETLERLTWHDAQGHNTYVRMCLFKSRNGTLNNAHPSPILWIDDVLNPRIHCSILIET